MGRWFARFFTERGRTVLLSDRATSLSNADLAAQCAVLIVCVPLRTTPAVIEEVARAAPATALVVSTASLMLPSLPGLRQAPGEALCLHPLFGPAVPTVVGQVLISATVRAGPLSHWLTDTLTGAGATVRALAPRDHDTAMASVQVMQHAAFVAFTNALAAADLDVTAALQVATPSFRLFLALAARIVNQPASLYGDIVTLNPRGPAALERLRGALDEVSGSARAADAEEFEGLFERARAYFTASPALAEALIAEADAALAALQAGQGGPIGEAV